MKKKIGTVLSRHQVKLIGGKAKSNCPGDHSFNNGDCCCHTEDCPIGSSCCNVDTSPGERGICYATSDCNFCSSCTDACNS